MSMIADLQLSQAHHDIAVKAVDYALRALDGAEPLVPFTITWREGDITLERFRYGAYEDAIELAMRAINAAAGDALEAYAVVWSGYVDGGEGKREAIIVEVGDGDTPRSMQLAQLLALGEDGSPMLDGPLMALGDAPNLLRDRFTVLDQENHLVKPAYVTTDSFARDVKSQPYAQMPVAVICLAANLFEGEEGERITLGIRKLQSLEPDTSIKLIHRVFSIVTSAVASGDLMEVLPTEHIEDMAKIVLDGAAQLKLAVAKGLVWDEHASAYFAAVKSILMAVLTRDGAEPMPEAGAKLVAVLDKACT
ncbi:MAG: hypothetical protein KDG55_04815 [Rhodocyclaceae bacterium]|nr:hypothetical protein [Rhodocyclaceae bacterium]